MLDLKKLEKQIDEVLEKETEDSFNQWLIDKQRREAMSLLGEGNLRTFESQSMQLEMLNIVVEVIMTAVPDNDIYNCQYSQAA